MCTAARYLGYSPGPGDLYPSSFAPLFFYRREISDEIHMNTRTSRTRNRETRYRVQRERERERERANVRWDESIGTRFSKIHTGNIHMYGISRGWIPNARLVHFSFFRENRQFVFLRRITRSDYKCARTRRGRVKFLSYRFRRCIVD